MNILVHTSFIGETGYNNHSRDFFTALNKFHTVKIRNYTVGKSWWSYNNNCHDGETYLTDEMKDMLILQTLYESDGSRKDYRIYGYKFDFEPDLHIILNDVGHCYFYEKYDKPVIGYNVWESTEYPKGFFEAISLLDEFWVPSEWQKNNLISQGYPEEKIFVVPEGINPEIFKPEQYEPNDKFTFLLFGRWEYRKSTQEIIKTFNDVFSSDDSVRLVISVDNPFATDGLESTEMRLKHYGLEDPKIEILHFPEKSEYLKILKSGNVFLSCARGEGWNLPLCEAMACGIPSIYSKTGGQMEFANGLGIPVNILNPVPASNQDPSFVGSYFEPDYHELGQKMKEVKLNYDHYKNLAIEESKSLRNKFNWMSIAKTVADRLSSQFNYKDDFVFVTAGDSNYMGIIEDLVKSLELFSSRKILVYGVNSDNVFDNPNVIFRELYPPLGYHSKHDKWYWKQEACLESLKEGYKNYVWIDGDAIANLNIDQISNYFKEIENYPLSDIHHNQEFYANYQHKGETQTQSFNQHLHQKLGGERFWPMMHVCLFVYNSNCKKWFEEVIETYRSIDLDDYDKYLQWNDEGIENALRWKYGYKKHLPQSNFDLSSYDGDNGKTQEAVNHFFTFQFEEGPKNFNRVYGYQYYPEDKSNIIYFHGNKDRGVSNIVLKYLEMKKTNSFHMSEYFFTEKYKLENLGDIKEYLGGTLEVANKFGWHRAIYHEIYNLKDYDCSGFNGTPIKSGDVVLDVGANIGIFNRWAYSQGASKVISFEPDKRYFKLLSLNAHPNSILFNAAVSNSLGSVKLFESNHLGGSNIFVGDTRNSYNVETYTIDSLFRSGLISEIDFLKIDIEGAELKLFEGCSDDNLRKIKKISMEYHHSHLQFDVSKRDELIKRLNRLGFNSEIMFMGNNEALQMIYFWR